MYYVKDKLQNVLFASRFFREAHQYAQEFAEKRNIIIVLWKNDTIIKYFNED